MARRKVKRNKREALVKKALQDIPSDRPGLPAKDSIKEVISFVSPQNEEYRILRTDEVDPYEEPAKPDKT